MAYKIFTASLIALCLSFLPVIPAFAQQSHPTIPEFDRCQGYGIPNNWGTELRDRIKLLHNHVTIDRSWTVMVYVFMNVPGQSNKVHFVVSTDRSVSLGYNAAGRVYNIVQSATVPNNTYHMAYNAVTKQWSSATNFPPNAPFGPPLLAGTLSCAAVNLDYGEWPLQGSPMLYNQTFAPPEKQDIDLGFVDYPDPAASGSSGSGEVTIAQSSLDALYIAGAKVIGILVALLLVFRIASAFRWRVR